ncbi:4-hydroxyphenylacetate 3-hydroxylase N-terminal domain-containing protein [Lentzea sp. NPDC051208]|uniref:4-hydroxyphenylacetate 3-hydroxylase family protein n=1 Tax=Lentzea sp. NPDC051208 TaxID=3154642 RepID=UPI00342327C1
MNANLRTGEHYLESLRDGREVYLDGRRVDDVTSEPGLCGVAETFARMYDLARTDEWQDTLTFVAEDGQRYGGAWMEPRDREQLAWRRAYLQAVARHTGGLFGRPVDYVPLFHLGMLDIRHDFSRGDAAFEQNIVDYWKYARERDLALAHAFIDPPLDPASELPETSLLKVVAQTEEGVVVRGVKSVATFAVHADECLVGAFPRPGLSPEHVVYFSTPMAAKGLRIVAREAYGKGNAFDRPVSQYGDENDAILIFDDVFVPWNRVFSYGDPKFALTVFPRITEWAHWSIICRLAVKAEVLLGLCALIPEMVGRARTPQAREALGETIRYLTTLRAFIHASEDQGKLSTSGYWMPDSTLVTTGRAYSVEHYRRIISYVQDLGSQGLINMPTEATFDHPAVGETLDRTFSSPSSAARDRARVLHLGWDMVCDSYGGRQTLFELFNAMPWTAQRDLLVTQFDAEPYKLLAKATAGMASLDLAARVVGTGQGDTLDYESMGTVYANRSLQPNGDGAQARATAK